MPLTDEQEKAGTRQLRQWLENDKRLVTFRDLSRAVGCHVDLAKNLLLSLSSTRPDLHKTYLLTGPLLSSAAIARTQLTAERLKAQEDEKSLAKLSATQKIRVVELDEISDGERNSEDGEAGDDRMDIDPDNILNNDRGAEDGISGLGDKHARAESDTLIQPEQTSRWGVVMAGEERLEEKRALFEADKLSIHVYALAPAPVRHPAQYLTHIPDLRSHKNYRNPVLYGTITGDMPTSSSASTSKGMKDGAMSFGTGTKKSAPLKDEKAKKPAEPVKSVKGQSTLGKAVKKEPSPAPAVAKAAEKNSKSSAAIAGPSQRKPSARAKRQIQSDDEEEAEMVKTDTAEPEERATGKDATSSMIRAEDDQAAMEAMMDMDMDFDMSGDEVSPPKKAAPIKGAKGTEGRKKRKVTRTVTETNAKGYTVTKTITEEVSCSEGEADEASAPKSKAKAGRNSAVSGSTSRASSVTDAEDRKPSISASSSLGLKGSTSSAGGGAGAGTKGLSKPAAKPAAGKPKGQSTLAGFFTKK